MKYLYCITSHLLPRKGAQQDNGTERVNPETIKTNNIKEGSDFLLDSAS